MTGTFDRRNFLRLSGAAAAATAVSPFIAATPAAAITTGKPPIPGPDLAYLGVYEYKPEFPKGISQPEALEEALGAPSAPRQFAINHCFRLVDETPTDPNVDPGTLWAPVRDRFLADKADGRIPMLSWAAGKTPIPGLPPEEGDPIERLREIARGERNVFIDGQADALHNLNTPVFLRFTWEFDQRYHGHPTEFKNAWIHTYNRFQLRGATNVAFVWCPTRNAFNLNNGAEADQFWPGMQYVDWIGCDGYSRPTNPLTFFSLFLEAHLFAIEKGLPLMIGETGVQRESDPTVQRDWLNSLIKNLNDGRFAQLKALNFYHRDVDTSRFRFDTDPAGETFAAFKALAAHPRLL